ncbi:hypothetical protein [Microscilla marina]|uniref:Lipoprotein, putative n=1 Tax=Microscilla marina ATCC 23134 TaxID=313606 RepID=A1ZVR5_MICM2|nr:hypothetical protein [Microscilla marina]EAY25492.1 lipoprotein, putative [Microscilla marina ATCC 23134]
MKNHSFLSMVWLCLLFPLVSSCGKVQLPVETPLFLDQTSVAVSFDSGNYLNNWNRVDTKTYVESKLTTLMQENRVEVQGGLFVNTPFKLTIRSIRFEQKTGTAIRCPEDCGIVTVSREKVRLDVAFALHKNGQLIKKWDFCNVAKESIYEDYSPYSDCPVYSTGTISVESMLDRCIEKIQQKVSRRMKNNL